jgi:hypothetical protein
VPELAVHPGHAGDEAVGRDAAPHGTGVGVDLHDAAVAVLAHPQAALGPGQARAALARRRDGGDDGARGGVDLGDACRGDLPQVAAVEGGAGVAGVRQTPLHLAAGRRDGQQGRIGRGPDVFAVVRDAMDGGRAVEGAVLADDLGGLGVHGWLRLRAPRAAQVANLRRRRRGGE